MEVSIRELKNHLSAYLRRAQAGEEIVVTSRGKRVARLAKPLAEPAEPTTTAIERLRSQSWIIPARKQGKPQGLKQPLKLKSGTKTLAETIIKDRG